MKKVPQELNNTGNISYFFNFYLYTSRVTWSLSKFLRRCI